MSTYLRVTLTKADPRDRGMDSARCPDVVVDVVVPEDDDDEDGFVDDCCCCCCCRSRRKLGMGIKISGKIRLANGNTATIAPGCVALESTRLCKQCMFLRIRSKQLALNRASVVRVITNDLSSRIELTWTAAMFLLSMPSRCRTWVPWRRMVSWSRERKRLRLVRLMDRQRKGRKLACQA